MKKLGLFIILILFCVVSYSQNNAVYKRVSLDTLKSRTGTKKMYLKDTVIINNIIRIPAGATDGNIAYSNANGDVIWGTLPSEADSLFVSYCCGCNMVDGWKALEDTIKIDTCYVNTIIKDSLHALDTGKVSTSGDNMYGDLNVNADVYVDTLHYDALLPAIPSYWSRTPATGMLKPSTATDWLNIRDSTYIGIPPSAYPSGTYNKLIWLPSKGSLLAGNSSTTYANIGIRSINLGNLNTSSGSGSTTLGSENTASGQYSLSFGHLNSATADHSMAFGYGNSATATNSISIGYYNSATAEWGAVAIGFSNTASGYGSWALGSQNTSSALGSYGIGYKTTGTGEYSFRTNQYTTAQSYNSSVFGMYNVINGTTNSWVETDALFVIGNGSGTGANSHNALNLKKNGRLEIRNRTEGLNINERFVQEYNKKLHDGVNDTLYSIIVNSDSAMTAVLNFGYICNNGTERQCRSGVYHIACSIKMGSIVGYQFTSSSSVEHLTSGTLLEGLFLSYNKITKTIYVIINYDSSLNPSSAQARMNFTINNITGVSTVITNYNYNY